jgi:thiosulfate/3-mercaptopyruvate sulfurtransferase
MTLQSSEVPIVSAEWLTAALYDPGLVILDSSWYLPGSPRSADAEYRAAHIPRAVRFDIDIVSDQTSELPHMLPTPGEFAAHCEAAGIAPDSRVVVYDGSATNLSAARVWWMFRVFGHRTVSVLDGGFRAWASATRPVQAGVNRLPPTSYPAPLVDGALVVDLATIEAMVADKSRGQIIDCRSAERFRGEVDEPRGGLRRGNIPSSHNMPYSELTDSVTGCFLKPAALRSLLARHGIDISMPIVASCGSGVSAGVLALALEVIRAADPTGVGPPVAIYDGSWAEYGKS